MQRSIGVLCFVGIVTAQTGANCDVPCENYGTELQNANNLYSQNVNNVGGVFTDPAATVNAVCGISGTDIQTCFVCSTDGQGLSDNASALTLLDAWWETCVTFQDKGVNDAYDCWLSVPNGSGDCEYLASDPNTPQSGTSTTSTSPTPVSSSSSSQSFGSTTSTSQASNTPKTSSMANASRDWHAGWQNSLASSVVGLLINLLW